jgi:hypothetical protein
MNHKSQPRTLTVWQYFDWRCEYTGRGETPELRLYMAEHLVVSDHPGDTFDTLEKAARWLTLVKGTRADVERESQRHIPERRTVPDRRAAPRGGRRAEDATKRP